jgi:hypothetical protein
MPVLPPGRAIGQRHELRDTHQEAPTPYRPLVGVSAPDSTSPGIDLVPRSSNRAWMLSSPSVQRALYRRSRRPALIQSLGKSCWCCLPSRPGRSRGRGCLGARRCCYASLPWLYEGAAPHPAPGLPRLGGDIVHRVAPVREHPRHQPAADVDPRWARRPWPRIGPLDHLATLTPTVRASRAAKAMVPHAGPATETSGPVRGRRSTRRLSDNPRRCGRGVEVPAAAEVLLWLWIPLLAAPPE